MLHAFRERLRAHPVLRRWYRGAVAVAGVLVMLLGLVLVPLPGPGWLIVFAGLAVLATEFAWAARAAGPIRRGVARMQAAYRARKAARGAEPA
ncbi:TIGR02611 family protein [Agromyces sp. MMS17-SY077]|uniref:TIGR02611 family protein n=2 Tax=Agromyces seonyuensis TaxID=2662446 RepID=A0A6I4P6T8_9MICO|nr:TIGR02611 family protein [Agromyces seonyuensis]